MGFLSVRAALASPFHCFLALLLFVSVYCRVLPRCGFTLSLFCSFLELCCFNQGTTSRIPAALHGRASTRCPSDMIRSTSSDPRTPRKAIQAAHACNSCTADGMQAVQAWGMGMDVESSKRLAESLDKAGLDDDAYFNQIVRIMATRCMTQAKYFSSGTVSPAAFRHYGLAAPIYTHFTSPIRRHAPAHPRRLAVATVATPCMPRSRPPCCRPLLPRIPRPAVTEPGSAHPTSVQNQVSGMSSRKCSRKSSGARPSLAASLGRAAVLRSRDMPGTTAPPACLCPCPCPDLLSCALFRRLPHRVCRTAAMCGSSACMHVGGAPHATRVHHRHPANARRPGTKIDTARGVPRCSGQMSAVAVRGLPGAGVRPRVSAGTRTCWSTAASRHRSASRRCRTVSRTTSTWRRSWTI